MKENKKQNKNQRRRKKSSFGMILGIAIVLVAAIIVAVVIFSERDSGATVDNETNESAEASADMSNLDEETEDPGLPFPYQLEGGKLEVASLFQFTGFNQDCNGEEGEDIASISFTNTSEEFLTSVKLTAVLRDGTELHFEAEDVPAGQGVLAFSKENASYDMANVCESITCEAEFAETAPLLSESVSISVEETAVTIVNLTDEELTDLVIHCHTLFDGNFFGGLTYSYPAESIEAGGSITLQAEDCYLGEAAVVRIDQEN